MSLQDEIEELINKHNAELPSGTPDYILARYLMDCLESFHFAVECRTRWHNGLEQPTLDSTEEAWALVNNDGLVMQAFAREEWAKVCCDTFNKNAEMGVPYRVVRIPPLPMEPAQ